jgi:hypothetical protein
MHKVSLFFSKQSSESDIYDIRHITTQTTLMRTIHQMKLIHSALDNFEAALCMFISGSGASKSRISDDTFREALAALTAILDFARGGSRAGEGEGESTASSASSHAGEYSSFHRGRQKRRHQLLCAKLGIVDRLFCIMSVPLVMGGENAMRERERLLLCLVGFYMNIDYFIYLFIQTLGRGAFCAAPTSLVSALSSS